MGRVAAASQAELVITAEASAPAIEPGDGLVFDAADWRSPQEAEEGGRVYNVEPAGRGRSKIEFANGAVNPARIRPGDLVWRTHSPAVDKAARPFLDPAAPVAKQRVDVRVTARVGSPLRMAWTLARWPAVRVEIASDAALAPAENRGLDLATLREQLGRLGNTAYALGEVELDSEGSPFAAVSTLNQLRRQAVERLAEAQAGRPEIDVHDPASAVAAMTAPPVSLAQSPRAPRIHLLVRTPEQLDAALEASPSSITLDYLDLYGLRPSLERVQARGIEARVASPRVFKPGEERILDFLLRCDVPILVRPAGLLHSLRDRPHRALTGDFSLNAANAISAAELLALGLDRITPTHDLNAAQIAELARRSGPERIEVLAYQHLPVFHTEHCVFCRFLSTGTSYKDCGRPCERHRVALIDSRQDSDSRAHPVMADVGCRNTVFGAEAQEASRFLDSWLTVGIRHFRLEFVHESGADVRRIVEAFVEYFAPARAENAGDSARLARKLRQLAPQGVTQGSLFVPSSTALLPILQ